MKRNVWVSPFPRRELTSVLEHSRATARTAHADRFDPPPTEAWDLSALRAAYDAWPGAAHALVERHERAHTDPDKAAFAARFHLVHEWRKFLFADPGLPDDATWAAIRERLKEADLEVRHVHTVVVTHSHPDHFGGAARFHEASGARIRSGADVVELLGPFVQAVLGEDGSVLTPMGPPNVVLVRARQSGRAAIDVMAGSSTRWPAARLWAIASAPCVSTPITRTEGLIARRAEATPVINPPPPMLT